MCQIFEPLLLNSWHLSVQFLTFKCVSVPPDVISQVFSPLSLYDALHKCLSVFKIISYICSVLLLFVFLCVREDKRGWLFKTSSLPLTLFSRSQLFMSVLFDFSGSEKAMTALCVTLQIACCLPSDGQNNSKNLNFFFKIQCTIFISFLEKDSHLPSNAHLGICFLKRKGS